jgi:hypothetical protein
VSHLPSPAVILLLDLTRDPKTRELKPYLLNAADARVYLVEVDLTEAPHRAIQPR